MNSGEEASAGRVAILGIGNLLMGDEGFGVHVINHLLENWSFPDTVQVHDAGTAGIYLGPILEDADWVMVVDVLQSDLPPGSLEYFDGDKAGTRTLHSALSPHQLGILELLEICRLRGRVPGRLEFLCTVPERIATGMELSPCLERQVPTVCQEIIDRMHAEGIVIHHA